MRKDLHEILFGYKDWKDKPFPELIELLIERVNDVDDMRDFSQDVVDDCEAVLTHLETKIKETFGCSALELWQLVQHASGLTDINEEDWNASHY